MRSWEPRSYMEDLVPRAPWQRRRTTDSDRPAGRRWAGRLRSARQVLRVGRRRTENATSTSLIVPGDSRTGLSRLPARLPRLRLRRRDGAAHDVVALAPYAGDPALVEPALTGRSAKADAAKAAEEPPALSIPLLPGERTLGRRIRFALVNGCTICQHRARHDGDLPGRRARRRALGGRLPDLLRGLRRPRRRAGPQAGRGQPVRRPDGLARRHVLVRARRAGRRLRLAGRHGVAAC